MAADVPVVDTVTVSAATSQEAFRDRYGGGRMIFFGEARISGDVCLGMAYVGNQASLSAARELLQDMEVRVHGLNVRPDLRDFPLTTTPAPGAVRAPELACIAVSDPVATEVAARGVVFTDRSRLSMGGRIVTPVGRTRPITVDEEPRWAKEAALL